jgi:hypothetical protein
MDTNKANQWLSLAANLGVLLGIVFLSLEIRQSNRIAIATTELSVRDSFSAHNESIYSNPDLLDVMVAAESSDAEFTKRQEQLIYAFIYRLINTWTATEVAFNNGMVPQYTFDSIKSDIENNVKYYPGMTPYFRQAVRDFPESDELEVYKVMRRLLIDNEQ